MIKKVKKHDTEINKDTTIGGGFPPFIITDSSNIKLENLLKKDSFSINKILNNNYSTNGIVSNIDEELINITTL